MKLNLSIFTIFIVGITQIRNSNGERTKDKMYEQINGAAACFRKLNGTHQTGCSSLRSGSTGIVHFVEDISNLEFIIKSGKAGPYIPVMSTALLTREVTNMLKNSDDISGLVVFNDTRTFSEHYTQEDTCPSRSSDLTNTCERDWNKPGTNLLQEDFPFPIFYVSDADEVKKIRDCFGKFNNHSYDDQYQRSLCALELSSFMLAATDTPTCVRRSNLKTNLNPVRICDALGDLNVWASLFPVKNVTEGAKKVGYIVVAARIDTTSLFHEVVPGAHNPVTGLVTLLTTAELLKRMLPSDDKEYERNVLFVLFNGETFDYIGSQRLIYDMEKDEFPMKFDANIKNSVPAIHVKDIELFIELSQLSRTSTIYAHSLDNKSEIVNFIAKLSKYTTLSLSGLSGVLPPASLQSFVKANPNISGLVLADHGYEYVNRYYNSIYDNVSNIDYHYYNVSEDEAYLIPQDSIQRHVGLVSEMVAKSIYEEITGSQYGGQEQAKIDLVNDLFNCYLLNPNCKVHKAIQRKTLSDSPYSLYVGVSIAPNLITKLIGLALAWFTGDIDTTNRTCIGDPHTPMYQYFNMSKSIHELNTTQCYRTTMNFTDAISPAFVVSDYDWSSGKYSSWAESVWRDFNVRMYLKPSLAHEIFTISIGTATFAFSLAVVYFVKIRSHILFVTPPNCSPTSC